MKSTTKLCKYCQSEIPAKAKVCPVCKRKLRKPILGIAIAIIFVFIFITAINGLRETPVNSGTTSGKEITMSEFTAIKTGMTYNEVVDIIGSEGELLSTSTIMDVTTSIYVWYGKDGISNANVTFSNNEVIGKAQIGLE